MTLVDDIVFDDQAQHGLRIRDLGLIIDWDRPSDDDGGPAMGRSHPPRRWRAASSSYAQAMR